MTWLAVFIGGGLGSLARFGFTKLASKLYSGSFPLGTFLPNLGACIVLGIAVAFFASKAQVNDAYKALVLVGFCGGFSTFSTFSNETLELMRANQWGWVIGNVVLSIVACVGVLWIVSRMTQA